MAEVKNQKPRNRILFRLFKGFIYGNVFGLIFGTAIFLLASAVNNIAVATSAAVANSTIATSTVATSTVGLPITPVMFLLLIYASSVVTGTAVEYSEWLETAE